jgi:formylglycine-generating enzyme required for sulfatase activity
VTQADYQRVMGENPSWFSATGPGRGDAAGIDTGRHPVDMVSWGDAQAFCRKLSDLPAERRAGRRYRLPTEAEWEYACRAGGGEAFGARGTLATSEANFNGEFPYAGAPKGRRRGSTVRVGSFPPNAWGLYDMSGNVWEWTSDNYAPYPGAVAPDTPAFTPDRKVIRGGSWLFGADSARCGLRYTHRPQDRGPSLGLRLAHDAE